MAVAKTQEADSSIPDKPPADLQVGVVKKRLIKHFSYLFAARLGFGNCQNELNELSIRPWCGDGEEKAVLIVVILGRTMV